MARSDNGIPKAVKEFTKTLPKFPDGRINYKDSPRAAVLICFVKFQDKILLLKRSKKVGTYQGMWNAVSGYLDELKPLRQKVFEELNEELGIEENKILKLTLGEIFEFDDKDLHKTWIIYPAVAELKSKSHLKIDWEHTELIWIYPKDLSKYNIIPNLKETLEKVT